MKKEEKNREKKGKAVFGLSNAVLSTGIIPQVLIAFVGEIKTILLWKRKTKLQN
ncbi:MAG: hypothetical protein LBG96_16230 [Tannerella sp.]|jgi:hypothetical protein|nr:hypothetical protein [Tannerella sp.]